ncbi:hypothetical protein EVAR_52080_1 [Eumeta japonica]|uniref:Uncharacterized protein n=1 Tax=Eumeta variegata TaxID=151549 RepID=A0A4C1Y2G3_EUMVA|nr:hypothetical protein EVAR_52080_1 [Eumeta japonica]
MTFRKKVCVHKLNKNASGPAAAARALGVHLLAQIDMSVFITRSGGRFCWPISCSLHVSMQCCKTRLRRITFHPDGRGSFYEIEVLHFERFVRFRYIEMKMVHARSRSPARRSSATACRS